MHAREACVQLGPRWTPWWMAHNYAPHTHVQTLYVYKGGRIRSFLPLHILETTTNLKILRRGF